MRRMALAARRRLTLMTSKLPPTTSLLLCTSIRCLRQGWVGGVFVDEPLGKDD